MNTVEERISRPVLCDSLGRPGEIEGWRRYFDFFWPQSGSLEQLSQGMMDVCTLPDASPFLTSLRAVRWVDGKMIAVKDGNFLEEEDGKIKVTALKDAQEIKQKLTEYFPEIDRSTIDAAIFSLGNHHIQKCVQAGHGGGFPWIQQSVLKICPPKKEGRQPQLSSFFHPNLPPRSLTVRP